ncbi:arginyl-tRNA synthetase [Coprinopsis cinerea okayama7|uniref:arginine--tRNA ligase n=1 Tax=Coprinopsis cinerea (strain Okayama-7 / 130 / ATCC MYA-4618 / FGSC 9003) TaxID=240176 RepID=A8NRC3_COPC7|nr:arginyl-tRNA synthetase [Coprinopsis cinerea okayama7\|eukprot:XP_001835750.1 arginyl-tRNA synthetase [Coprinopsis cinerea okayama7\
MATASQLLKSYQPSFSLPPLPVIPETNPSACVLDSFRTAIAQLLSESLGLPIEKAYDGVDYGKKGEDFTVALPRFRLPGKVDEIAKKVIDKFTPNEYIESVVHDKAFLHFRLNTNNMIRAVLTQVYELTHVVPKSAGREDGLYGQNSVGEGKKVIIEYSSPNIAKSFHVGHLRSTIIGAFLANLYKTCGWDVVSMNYLGDWGTQFGMIASGYEKYGNQEALEADAIKHLFDVYVQVNKDAEADPEVKANAAAWFKRMEDGDPAALENWKVWRSMSIKKYEDEYERLNVSFDVYTGESEVGKESIDKALERLDEMGLIEESNGAKLINLEKWKLGKAVVRKKDGTSIYLTRDIGGAIERYEKYKFDKMIYVVSSQQDLHLAQFFKVLELMEFPWAKDLLHINYGLVQGMSTRKGTVVFLNQIINEAASVMHEQMKANEEKYSAVEDPETTSREIGITGVKIQDMAAKRINNYTFNWERMLSFEGDTGPYLQYAHVRLESLKRKNPHLLPLAEPKDLKLELLASPHTPNQAREIAFLLGSYPDVVKTALKTHEPSGVVTFAFRLAHAISSAWDAVVVKSLGEDEKDKASARLFLYFCARDVLGSALKLLTIRPLERM